MDKTIELFDQARRELLDLSQKNSLINFKPRKAYGVFFTHTNNGEIFNHFVTNQKSLSFTTEASTSINRIQIAIEPGMLKTKLNKTYRQSKSFIEEKGINTLFLAVGFIKTINTKNDLNAPLLLIPVELRKREQSETYSLHYSNEEIRENISILTKLRNDFKVDLAYNEEEITDLDKYFRYIIKLLDGNEHVKIDCEECALDFFSFTKLLMFQDLKLENWSDKNGKINNKICKKLFVTDFSNKDEEITGDINAATICNVLDSDSSQSEAIYEIINGKNLVLQGPPGTGKSQTITNIIASCIASGKSVLFVSEKMAALDVVKRRLESVGLGDLVLELHSHKTNKKSILSSIEETLLLGEPKTLSNNVLYEKYVSQSLELNDYINKLNADIRNTGFTLSEIYAQALEIEDMLQSNNVKLPKIEISGLEKLNKNEYTKRLTLLEELVSVVSSIGVIEKHPLYGVDLDSCMPFEQIAIKDRLVSIEDTLLALYKVGTDLANFFGVRNCSSIADTPRILSSLKYLNGVESFGGLNQTNDLFSSKDGLEKIQSFIKESKTLQDTIKDKKTFKEQAFSERKYNDYVLEYSKTPSEELKEKISEVFVDKVGFKSKVKQLKAHYDAYNHFIEEEKLVENIFGDFYEGVYTTDWKGVDVYIKRISKMYELIQKNEIISQVKLVDYTNKTKLQELITRIEESVAFFYEEYEKFVEQTQYNAFKKYHYATWYNDYSFTDVKRIISSMKNQIGDIDKIASYNNLVAKIKQLGMRDIVKLIGNFKYDYIYLVYLFKFTYFDYLINIAYEVYPELNEFKKYKATRLVEIFKELDMKVMVENIKQILLKHWETMPKFNDQTKDMSIIRRELQKKRNHMNARKLISRTSDSILKIKPVFMMSPLSIAQYLAPNEVVFDIVIFDEASQVKPVDAFGALLRAKQIVVVGDSKQLPPTSFFDKVSNKFDEVSDDDYEISSMESILSLLLAKNVKQRTLEWHYRSRHQSLILFSNKTFYDNKLKTFPSIYESDENLGLVFEYNPNTAYDRGKTSVNQKEAKQVIAYAFEQVKKTPHLSMGVASFSIVQQEALIREFDKKLKACTDPEVKKYFFDNKESPFFIKNLENVQGDERDIILISIGYGFDENKKLTMDFGPINKNDGERRLNVLVTRAKEKCVVFSNLKASDINLTRTNSSGVSALKNFLQFAEGRSSITPVYEHTQDSLFVSVLNKKLKEYGYTTSLEVGASVGIDIAIYDEELKSYVCGIETDFGAYGVIESPTDRERIRHNVLKSLGWKIYHIWSNDYYRNSKLELDNILNFIDASKVANKEAIIQKNLELNFQRKNAEEIKVEEFKCVYKKYSGQKRRVLVLSELETLTKIIDSIVDVESPVHTAVVKKRLLEITNKEVYTDNEIDTFNKAIKNTSYNLVGDFLINPANKIWIRNRKEQDLTIRKIDHLHDSEIIQSIKYIIQEGLANSIEEFTKEITSLLGFNRNVKLNTRIQDLITKLEERNEIYLEDDVYFVSDEDDK